MKKTFYPHLFIIFLILPYTLIAQEEPLLHSFHYELTHVGLIIEQGDVNEDGRLDLAAWVNGKIRLFYGNGDGSFVNDEANDFSSPGTHELVLADVNSDDHLDLLGSAEAAVYVQLGNGDGTFGPASSYKTANESSDIAVADLNNDGILDLAVGNDKRQRVHVFRGKRDGTFHPALALDAKGESPRRVTVGQFDDDNLPDLAFTLFQNDYVSLFFSMGGAAYSPAVKLYTFDNPAALETGDFNEDMHTDLVVSASGYLQVFFGDGLGNFSAPVNIGLGYVNPTVLVEDFDEDGHLDLAAPFSGTAAIVRGFGDGNFSTPAFYTIGESAYDLVTGDWNSDGELDLAGVDFAFDGLSVLLGRGDATFGPHLPAGTLPQDLTTVDLDSDGILDIVSVSSEDDGVTVFSGKGSGWFSTGVSYPAGLDSKPGVVVSGDFTADGVVDVATASKGLFGGKVQVLPGQGDGTLDAPLSFAAGNDLRDLKVGYLNNDNIPDLVTVSNGLGRVYVLIGLVGGGFAPAVDYDAWLSPAGVAIGDFNEDGDQDVITANDVSNDTLQLFLNRGDGTLGPRIPIDTDLFHQNIRCADLNNDLHLDLVTTAIWGQRVSVYLGNGDGTFEAPLIYDGYLNPARFDIGDINNDDLLDVVVAQQHQFFEEGSVGLFLGNGDGTLQTPLIYETMDDTESIALGDLDGDGVLDVTAVLSRAHCLTVMCSRSGPWDNLGRQLPGLFGFSRQTGEGPLEAASTFSFRLDDAFPFSSAYHVIGLSQVNVPFKGGVLVPKNDLITGPFPLDSKGRFFFEATWPSGVPAGTEMFFQFWYLDPGGPYGFAASNALQATTP